MSETESHFPVEPHLLADHPALDLLNTVALINRVPFDYFQSGADVLRWLQRMGIEFPVDAGAIDETQLATSAKILREVVRELVIRHKNGEVGDTRALNDYLAKAPSFLRLRQLSVASLVAERVAVYRNPESLLAPLAEAAVELLLHGDFALVRNCEHPGCMLWFYDKTKSHRRRWCSMSLCGNRHKVAQFRKRQVQAAPSTKRQLPES